MLKIEIDSQSGFCFGVVNAINKAEKALDEDGHLFCLGDIVHNYQEVKRLEKKGLSTIDHSVLSTLQGTKVLLRAHGEPPSTYELANKQGIDLIDATCPVVLKLQQKIRAKYENIKGGAGRIVIFGKRGHAEVNGLIGQTEGTAIVIEHLPELDTLDFQTPIYLFSQTTKSVDEFHLIVQAIKSRIADGVVFEYSDTICRQVSNKIPHIKNFAKQFSVVIFVSGKKSSNGKVLFEECLSANPRTYMVSESSELTASMIEGATSVGICGATSTPRWLMEEVADQIRAMDQSNE